MSTATWTLEPFFLLAPSYPPRCFHSGRYAAHEQIQEKGAIKRGYFVRVNGSMSGNGNAQRPGLYLNLDMVELSAYGPEIVSGPDAEGAFGGGPAALPAGASATPVGTPGAPPANTPPGPYLRPFSNSTPSGRWSFPGMPARRRRPQPRKLPGIAGGWACRNGAIIHPRGPDRNRGMMPGVLRRRRAPGAAGP